MKSVDENSGNIEERAHDEMKWNCPNCGETNSMSSPFDRTGELRCVACAERIAATDALCPVCDAPNPWTPRDSVHYWCTVCGETQARWENLRTA
jgi:DNA-directed RNA polymerase subunit RPC12/RpoP